MKSWFAQGSCNRQYMFVRMNNGQTVQVVTKQKEDEDMVVVGKRLVSLMAKKLKKMKDNGECA